MKEIAEQHRHLKFGHGFQVVLGDENSQAAQMTLGPGETEGGPDNRHCGVDQWLYVVSGTGQATVNGERLELREGKLVLIQRDDRHEIRNTGSGPLQTLNVYVPPAYTEEGEELPLQAIMEEARWSFVDFCYFSTITMTTVGYGDILPHSPKVRAWVTVQCIIGVFYVGFALSLLWHSGPAEESLGGQEFDDESRPAS